VAAAVRLLVERAHVVSEGAGAASGGGGAFRQGRTGQDGVRGLRRKHRRESPRPHPLRRGALSQTRRWSACHSRMRLLISRRSARFSSRT
jgi:hypothetical protein